MILSVYRGFEILKACMTWYSILSYFLCYIWKVLRLLFLHWSFSKDLELASPNARNWLLTELMSFRFSESTTAQQNNVLCSHYQYTCQLINLKKWETQSSSLRSMIKAVTWTCVQNNLARGHNHHLVVPYGGESFICHVRWTGKFVCSTYVNMAGTCSPQKCLFPWRPGPQLIS